MSLAARNRLAARVASQYYNGGHRTYFVPDLNDVAAVGTECAANGTAAAASAAEAAAAAAAALEAAGGSLGVGSAPMETPRTVELGECAFLNYAQAVGVAVRTNNGAYQMLPQDWNALLLTTSGTNTYTLPAASDVPLGWFVNVKNRSGNNLTLSRSGSDTINGTTSVTVSAGTATRVVKSGSTSFETF